MFSGNRNPFSDPSARFAHAGDALNPTPQHTAKHDQGENTIVGKIPMEQPSLGLTLRKTPSFLDLIQRSINKKNLSSSTSKPHDESLSTKAKQMLYDDKVKASNLNALLLRIGTWQRESKHEGDLVAKCYFAKRKMVWEFLENALKRKIEIDWSDIIAMRAVTKEDEPGVLEIELNKPPNFYNELDPQPRRHTQWQTTTDFTNDQAQICRRHYVLFPPRTLDKHYEKLIQYDGRFFQMSQKGFPTLRSPYFQRSSRTVDFSFPQPFVSQNFHLHEQATQPCFNIWDSPVMGAFGQKDYHVAKWQRTAFWGQNDIFNYCSTEDDNNYYNNGGDFDFVQNQVKRSSMSTITSRTLANLPLPLASNEEQQPSQTLLEIEKLEANFTG